MKTKIVLTRIDIEYQPFEDVFMFVVYYKKDTKDKIIMFNITKEIILDLSILTSADQLSIYSINQKINNEFRCYFNDDNNGVWFSKD